VVVGIDPAAGLPEGSQVKNIWPCGSRVWPTASRSTRNFRHLDFPAIFLAIFIRSLSSLTFARRKKSRHTLFSISSSLSINYLWEIYLLSLLVNYIILNKIKIGRIQFYEILIAYANFIIVRVIIQETVKSICGRCQSVKGVFLSRSLFPSLGGVQSSSGVPAPFVFTPDWMEVAWQKRCRVCGPEIKRPSANEVNGARGVPRYSREWSSIFSTCACRGGTTSTRNRAETKKRRTPTNYPATRSQCERPFDRGRTPIDVHTRARYPRDTWKVTYRNVTKTTRTRWFPTSHLFTCLDVKTW